MKTKFNCLLVTFIFSAFLFSCKTRNIEVVNQLKEEADKSTEISVFRPKRIFISTDSSTFRLVFENEYDELGRLKTENYYPGTNDVNNELNTLYRKELSYTDKLISTKSFAKVKYTNYYGKSGWDSIFHDNSGRKIKQKSLAAYQPLRDWANDSIYGVNSNFDFTYSSIGDSLIENQKGARTNQASNTTRYIDQNNVIVKYADSEGCSSINTYKLETSGSFASRCHLSYFIGNETKLFSNFELKFDCPSWGSRIISNLNWSFDSQGRPIRLTLSGNADGVITKSYYRYEY